MTAASASRETTRVVQKALERASAYNNAVQAHKELQLHIAAGNIPSQVDALAELRASRIVLATAHSAYLRALADVDRQIAAEACNAHR